MVACAIQRLVKLQLWLRCQQQQDEHNRQVGREDGLGTLHCIVMVACALQQLIEVLMLRRQQDEHERRLGWGTNASGCIASVAFL